MQLAKDIHEAIATDEIFHFRGAGPLLLITDRMDDPVTPLLSQWTYQAMVHELLGLNNNRVVLRGAPGVKKDFEEVVLSAAQDDFFRKNRHANFGELGEAIKSLLDDFQRQTQQSKVEHLNSIEDMQQFMEKFPQIRSQSYNVSKHVAIMGELARLVDVCSLMDISQFEQELACTEDHGSHVRELLEKLANPNVQTPDKLRLGLLYALRYEQVGNVNMVKQRMIQGGVPSSMVQLVDIMLRYAGAKVRGPGLFGTNGDIVSKMTKSFMTSVQGVSNVYAQHVPVLMDTINLCLKGKLKESTHPYVSRSNAFAGGAKPHEVIVFMAGGTTFEEGSKIAEFNATNSAGIKVILAGSTIHNSTSFLEELKRL
jgi:vacuolar protein sorting-associated protein 45